MPPAPPLPPDLVDVEDGVADPGNRVRLDRATERHSAEHLGSRSREDVRWTR